jgi:hypothetical protein
MDVRVIIVSRADETCHVCVLAPNPSGRSWSKNYKLKQECLNELISVGLLTPTEEAKCHGSDSANVLVIEGDTAPEILRAAGFVEQKKGYLN